MKNLYPILILTLLLSGCEILYPSLMRNDMGRAGCKMSLPDGSVMECSVDNSEGKVYKHGKVVVEEDVIEIKEAGDASP